MTHFRKKFIENGTEESAPCFFSLFYKSTTSFCYCECRQIKVDITLICKTKNDRLHFRMMRYSNDLSLLVSLKKASDCTFADPKELMGALLKTKKERLFRKGQ